MTLYLFLLCALAFGSVWLQPTNSAKNKKNYAIYAFILIGGLSMFRKFTVGMDLWGHYYSNYKAIININWSDILSYKSRYEIGYVVFCRIIGTITKNPQVLIIIHSVIVVGFFCHFFYRYSDDITMSFILFIALNHWFTSLSMLRQIIAVCLCLYSTEILIDKERGLKRIIAVMLCDLIAILFHYSAVISILFSADVYLVKE